MVKGKKIQGKYNKNGIIGSYEQKSFKDRIN